jgi:hypothetical protein
LSHHSRAARTAAIIIDGLQGRFDNDTLMGLYLEAGLIPTDEAAILEMKREKTRRLTREAQRFRDKNDVQLKVVNLWEESEDGGRHHYFKKLPELNIEESVQFLGYCYRRRKYWDKQLHVYLDALKDIHGDTLQALLPFAIPKDSKPRKKRPLTG